jgi:hypothetical protein
MPNTNKYRINISVDLKLEKILEYLRSKYPLLRDADLIKMAVSSFYISSITDNPVFKKNSEEEKRLNKALKTKVSSVKNNDEYDTLMDYLN